MAVYSQQCTAVGSFAYASYFKLYVELTETYYNIENNYSNVHYKVYAQSSGSGSINATHRKYFTINGTQIIDSTVNVNVKSPNAYIAIAEGDINYIYHESDGTKTISFGALIKGSTYGIYAEKWDNFTLTTIPRASNVSSTSANIGEGITISINKASSGFTHTISYTFGSLSGTIATKTADSSVGFTLPSTFYAQIPNAKSGNGTITCQTYNGNTLLGTKTCSFTAYAKESDCIPTLSATAVDVNSATIALSGSNAKLIKSLSTARVTITASAKNSASISSKVVNNVSVSGTSIDFANVTVNTFTVTVTDSRGFTNTVTKTLTMVNYVPLTLSANFKRTEPTTGAVEVTFSGNYFNGSFGATNNTLAVKWYYQVKGASSWTTGGTISPTLSGNTYSNGQNPKSLGSIFDYTKEYNFKLTAQDKLTSLEFVTTVPKGQPVFNWGEDFFNVNGTITADNVYETEVVSTW